MKSLYCNLPVAVSQAIETLTERIEHLLEGGSSDLDTVERQLIESLVDVGRSVVAEKLSAMDAGGRDLLINGQRYWQAMVTEQHYMCTFGRITVQRGVYRAVRNGPTLCPMELRAGIVEGYWTPRAAKLAVLSVGEMTSYRAEQFFDEVGMMKPSRSSLERLPKAINEHWESNRESNEARLRSTEQVPETAVSVAVSLDGVMVPMRETEKAEKKAEMRRQGRPDKGPAGYAEVACGSLSFYDADGKRLLTRRFARMPEADKVTVKQQLRAELDHVLSQRADLVVVAVADGAYNNWSFFESLPHQHEVVDFFHAAEHLKRAIDNAMGASNLKSQRKFEELRHILRDKPSGVDTVIRSLAQLRPQRRGDARDYRTGINYFKRHRARMNYAALQEANLPIGSGVIEATCKSLASARLKRAGMRWQRQGGQALLNVRGWTQSERFDRAWELMRAPYIAEVAAVA